MKFLEIMLWIVGATLLALFAGVQAWGESERQRDVAAFVQARQPLAPVSDAFRLQRIEAPETGHAPDAAVLSAASSRKAAAAAGKRRSRPC